MKLRSAQITGLALAAITVFVTNPELFAFILTVQAVGLDLFFLLLALQVRTLVESFPVVRAVAQSAAVVAGSAVCRTAVAAVQGLFPRASFRVASVQLVVAAVIIVNGTAHQAFRCFHVE